MKLLNNKKDLSQEELIRLIDVYGEEIFGVCKDCLKDAYMTEKTVTDTYVEAWRKYSFHNVDSEEKEWITRIAKRICKKYLKSNWYEEIKDLESTDDKHNEISDSKEYVQVKDKIKEEILKSIAHNRKKWSLSKKSKKRIVEGIVVTLLLLALGIGIMIVDEIQQKQYRDVWNNLVTKESDLSDYQNGIEVAVVKAVSDKYSTIIYLEVTAHNRIILSSDTNYFDEVEMSCGGGKYSVDSIKCIDDSYVYSRYVTGYEMVLKNGYETFANEKCTLVLKRLMIDGLEYAGEWRIDFEVKVLDDALVIEEDVEYDIVNYMEQECKEKHKVLVDVVDIYPYSIYFHFKKIQHDNHECDTWYAAYYLPIKVVMKDGTYYEYGEISNIMNMSINGNDEEVLITFVDEIKIDEINYVEICDEIIDVN